MDRPVVASSSTAVENGLETPYNEQPYDVFLSHAGFTAEKQGLASQLCAALEKRGLWVCLDKHSLKHGEESHPQMIWAVSTAKVVVVVLSEDYVSREWTLKELEIALARENESKTRNAALFRNNQSYADFVTGKYKEAELKLVKRSNSMNGVIGEVLPLFFKLAPGDCNVENLQHLCERSGCSMDRWEAALNALRYITGIEYIERAWDYQEYADKSADTIIKNWFPEKRSDTHLDTRNQHTLPVSIVPQKRTTFGRQNALQLVEEAESSMITISGGGGMGKSHCAATYAHRFLEAAPDRRFVLWFRAADATSLRKDYEKAFVRLGGEPGEYLVRKTIAELLSRVWAKLTSSQYAWLLVFDNVPEVGGPEGFKDVFFSENDRNTWNRRGRIIFTTRSNLFCGETSCGSFDQKKVERLDAGNSARMFNAAMGMNSSDEAVTTLAHTYCGGLPLAIMTAAGLIKKQHTNVRDFLENFECQGVHDRITAILQQALEYARANGCGGVLDVVAYLNPDRIQLDLLTTGGDRQAIDFLINLNILQMVDDESLKIHRIHQAAVRTTCDSSSKAIDAMQRLLICSDPLEYDRRSTGHFMTPHLNAISSLEKSLAVADLMQAASAFWHMGGCTDSQTIDLLTRVLAIKKEKNAGSPSLGETWLALGMVFIKEFRQGEAIHCLCSALDYFLEDGGEHQRKNLYITYHHLELTLEGLENSFNSAAILQRLVPGADDGRCTICQERTDDTFVKQLPCCGQDQDQDRGLFCVTCVCKLRFRSIEGDEFCRCPRCRSAWLVLQKERREGTVVFHTAHHAGFCSCGLKVDCICTKESFPKRYICQACEQEQRIPYPMYIGTRTPDSCSPESWFCHGGCNDFTRCWKIVKADITGIPTELLPESWLFSSATPIQTRFRLGVKRVFDYAWPTSSNKRQRT